jgi:two-component system, NtrC family, response regulator AtoC
LSVRPEIVVVDDDPLALQTIKMVLSEEFGVHCFTRPDAAEAYLARHEVDLAVLDLNISDQSGLDVLREWRKTFPDLEIVFCSGETRVARAIQCLREGASDFVVKPFDRNDLLLIVRRVVEKSQLKRRLEKLAPMVHPHPMPFIGDSAVVRELLAKVEKLRGQPHLNVLILGESGTGKELVARLLHEQEQDPQRPFVVVNTPAIPTSLMEAELFGVVKGAYTDAKTSRAGKFELADGGDLFLDEIGDLPFETQAKILRTLQDRNVERVGSTRGRQVSFRVVSATNQPLADLIEAGKFREDLLYRLSDVVLWLAPLRDRKDDIPRLAEHFLRKYARGTPPRLADAALVQLMDFSWPGNVRQLESTLKRALAFNRGSTIESVECYDASHFAPGRPMAASKPLDDSLEAAERRLIEAALERNGGNRAAALGELKISRATFYRRVQYLGIPLK